MKTILPALLAFAGGVLTSFINDLITRAAIKRGGGMYLAMPLRTLTAAGYLAALYFISGKLGIDPLFTLIPGAVGHTAGLIFFTSRLLKDRGAEGGEAAEENANG
ncbi:MAG: hypothetical protein J5772_03920 [Clostridia bacterium]|nr:hypothetical protein [Clostridia bacterium]